MPEKQSWQPTKPPQENDSTTRTNKNNDEKDSTSLIRVSFVKPMGIVFEPRPNTDTGVCIRSLPPSGRAAQSHQVQVGDVLVQVNDCVVTEWTYDAILDWIVNDCDSSQAIRLVLERPASNQGGIEQPAAKDTTLATAADPKSRLQPQGPNNDPASLAHLSAKCLRLEDELHELRRQWQDDRQAWTKQLQQLQQGLPMTAAATAAAHAYRSDTASLSTEANTEDDDASCPGGGDSLTMIGGGWWTSIMDREDLRWSSLISSAGSVSSSPMAWTSVAVLLVGGIVMVSTSSPRTSASRSW